MLAFHPAAYDPHQVYKDPNNNLLPVTGKK